MSIPLCVRVGALWLFLLPGLAAGQEINAPTQGAKRLPENIQTALEAAWARHPAAQAARHTLDAAEARARAASRPIYNPEIEFGAERADVDTIEAGASLTLDIGGKRRARQDVGNAELEVARAVYALTRRDFVRQWLTALFSVGTAMERAAIARRQLTLIERFAELAERQLRVGDISTLERDLALLAREEARVQAATLAGQAAQARAAVRLAGGDVAIDIETSTIPFPEPIKVDAEILQLPEAVLASRQTSAAVARIVSAQRDRRADPTISVRGGRVDTGMGSEPVIGLSVSIPLHVRNNFRAEVDAAQADALNSEAQADLIDLELRTHAHQTYEIYRLLIDAWKQWERSGAGDIEKRADLLERLWNAGELSTSDYLVQLKQALDTALAAAELRGELLRAALDHLSATGRLDDWTGMPPVSGDLIP